MFFGVDGGCSRISSTSSQGALSMFLSVDSERSWISGTSSQGSAIDVS
jgi:hypothetical protein